MNELEQLKAQKTELETELYKVKDKINQIETDEFCDEHGIRVGDVIEFFGDWGMARKGKVEKIGFRLFYEIRLLRKNGDSKTTEEVYPELHQIKKLS